MHTEPIGEFLGWARVTARRARLFLLALAFLAACDDRALPSPESGETGTVEDLESPCPKDWPTLGEPCADQPFPCCAPYGCGWPAGEVAPVCIEVE